MAIERKLSRRAVPIVGLALLCGLLLPAAAFSQEVPDALASMPNKQLPHNSGLTGMEKSELKLAYNGVRDRLVTLAEKQKEFNDHFNEVIFPAWLVPDKVANIAKE